MIYDSITVSGSVTMQKYGSGSLTLDESGNVVMDRKVYMTGVSASHIHDALGYEPYNATNPSGYMSEITHNNITASLGFTPITHARTITINDVTYDLTANRSWTILGGVTAFNTRSGSITLTAADVTGSLGFTPYNATNPSGYTTNTGTVTGVTGTAPVVSSGGTAPAISMAAASSGVNGYMTGVYATKLDGIATGATANTGTVTSVATSGTVSGLTLTGGTITTSGTITLGGTLSLTSGNVTTALGFTPYSNANPSGYITGVTNISGNAGTVTNGVYTNTTNALVNSLWVNSSADITTLAGILTLYGTGNATTSQIMFKNTTGLGYGNHGAITGGYNTYFVMDTTDRGWIFRNATTSANVASISNTGVITATTFSGALSGNATTATTAARATRANGNFYIDDNYGCGIIGVYSSTVFQGVFAMGDAYKLTAGGGISNLYGLAWSHPNAGGQAANLSNHGLLVVSNGITQCALTNNIWCLGQFNGNGAGLTGTAASLSIGGTAGSISGFGNPTTAATANTIVYRDANGYITNSYYYASGGGSERNASGMGYFAGHNTSDYYYRSYTAAAAAALLSGQSMNISGTSTNITAYTINQSVGTSNSPTFYDLYSNQWIRNNVSNTGLYNTATTMHWSSNVNAYWDASSTTTVVGIRFYTGSHLGTLRGFVYADSSSNIGFLTPAGGWSLKMDSSGNATATGDITAYSDIRIKTNIETITDALDKVIALRGVYYNRTDNGDTAQKLGVIAQEIQKILPQVVQEQSDGMLSVAYGNMAALFIEAIKEQQSQIEELKTIINGLTR